MAEYPGTINRIGQYRGMLMRQDLEGMDTPRALEHIGKLRDMAFGLQKQDGVSRSISFGDGLFRRDLSPKEDACLHYLQSNSWEKLRLLKARDGLSVWGWEQQEIEKELFHLRRALNRDALKDLSTRHVSKVLTNMAALLNHVGRFSEAQEYWDRAVSFVPDYALAKGKRGYALTHYAHVLYDRSHIDKLLKKARGDLRSAVSSDVYEGARKYFSKRLAWLDSSFPSLKKGRDFALFNYKQGTTEEVTYRKWALEHRLFLNPLNDLGPYPAAMRDVLNVPAIVGGSRDATFFHGIFNQMKQAYVSARYLYYEGIFSDETHYSDRDVMLFDTMDYPSYSLAVEKTKSAFRMSYSIFDKIAFFLDSYMRLETPGGEPTFRSFWYEGQDRNAGLREEFRVRKNWPLRGLFWLSKDVYEDKEGFTETIEPDAREVSELRHQIEKRYLKLHEDFYSGMPASDPEAPLPNAVADSLAYSMHRGEFEAKTLRLLKRTRSALMYLCMAVHYEEKLKAKKHPEEFSLPAMTLSVLDDSWKI